MIFNVCEKNMYKRILMFLSLSCFLKTYSMELETSFLVNLKNKINSSLEIILVKEDSITSAEMQLLSNLFLCAIQYAQQDLHYNQLLRKLIILLETTKQNSTHSEENNIIFLKKFIKFCQRLINIKQKRDHALYCWHAATAYLDQPNQMYVSNIMRDIAQERLTLLNTSLENNNSEFESLLITLQNSITRSASQTNSWGNCIQALMDGTLPFNKESDYKALGKLEQINSIMSGVGKELLNLTKNNSSFTDYYEYFLTLSKSIDTFYYEALYEWMIKKSYDPIFCTIMFNDNGLIPENQRIQPLPHVVN